MLRPRPSGRQLLDAIEGDNDHGKCLDQLPALALQINAVRMLGSVSKRRL
jgi:hypothetical protein